MPTKRFPFDLDVLSDPLWQMHYGERFALEGILRSLAPGLAIEIGRANGGSLRRIAAHSTEVHSFDLVDGPERLREELDNVVFHTGDSSVQVPEQLAEFSAAGRRVDFALVDGDHSADGVRRDAEALLAAECCSRTVIVFHDTSNEEVRAGLDAVGFERHPHAALVLLDFVPGFVVQSGVYEGAIWNGLGLVVLDAERDEPPVLETDRIPAARANRIARDAVFSGAAAEAACAPACAASRSGRLPAAAALAGLLAGAAVGAIAASRRG